LDEIHLTASSSSLVAFTRVDQVNQQQQVFDPQPRSASAHDFISIGDGGVGPIHWY
jgi:hypothetical protein